MPNFHDLVNVLREPGDDGVPDTIYDDLTREFDTTLEGFNATTEKQNQKIAQYEAEVKRLKSANYDLLISVGTANEAENSTENEQDKPISFDDLFTKK